MTDLTTATITTTISVTVEIDINEYAVNYGEIDGLTKQEAIDYATAVVQDAALTRSQETGEWFRVVA